MADSTWFQSSTLCGQKLNCQVFDVMPERHYSGYDQQQRYQPYLGYDPYQHTYRNYHLYPQSEPPLQHHPPTTLLSPLPAYDPHHSNHPYTYTNPPFPNHHTYLPDYTINPLHTQPPYSSDPELHMPCSQPNISLPVFPNTPLIHQQSDSITLSPSPFHHDHQPYQQFYNSTQPQSHQITQVTQPQPHVQQHYTEMWSPVAPMFSQPSNEVSSLNGTVGHKEQWQTPKLSCNRETTIHKGVQPSLDWYPNASHITPPQSPPHSQRIELLAVPTSEISFSLEKMKFDESWEEHGKGMDPTFRECRAKFTIQEIDSGNIEPGEEHSSTSDGDQHEKSWAPLFHMLQPKKQKEYGFQTGYESEVMEFKDDGFEEDDEVEIEGLDMMLNGIGNDKIMEHVRSREQEIDKSLDSVNTSEKIYGQEKGTKSSKLASSVYNKDNFLTDPTSRPAFPDPIKDISMHGDSVSLDFQPLANQLLKRTHMLRVVSNAFLCCTKFYFKKKRCIIKLIEDLESLNQLCWVYSTNGQSVEASKLFVELQKVCSDWNTPTLGASDEISKVSGLCVVDITKGKTLDMHHHRASFVLGNLNVVLKEVHSEQVTRGIKIVEAQSYSLVTRAKLAKSCIRSIRFIPEKTVQCLGTENGLVGKETRKWKDNCCSVVQKITAKKVELFRNTNQRLDSVGNLNMIGRKLSNAYGGKMIEQLSKAWQIAYSLIEEPENMEFPLSKTMNEGALELDTRTHKHVVSDGVKAFASLVTFYNMEHLMAEAYRLLVVVHDHMRDFSQPIALLQKALDIKLLVKFVWVSRNKHTSEILEMVMEGVDSVSIDAPRRLSLLETSIVQFVSQLSAPKVFEKLKDVRKRIENVIMEVNPSGWLPYPPFVEISKVAEKGRRKTSSKQFPHSLPRAQSRLRVGLSHYKLWHRWRFWCSLLICS